MRVVRSLMVATLLTLGPWSVSHANEEDEIELTRQVIETERKAIVAAAMELTDEEAEVFWPLYNEYQVAMRAVSDQYIGLVKRYAEVYPEGASDDVAGDLMADWLAMESDRLKIQRKHIKKFGKVLPMSRVLRFFQVDNKLTSIIRADVAVQIPLN